MLSSSRYAITIDREKLYPLSREVVAIVGFSLLYQNTHFPRYFENKLPETDD